jgi:hypothetical protein
MLAVAEREKEDHTVSLAESKNTLREIKEQEKEIVSAIVIKEAEV